MERTEEEQKRKSEQAANIREEHRGRHSTVCITYFTSVSNHFTKHEHALFSLYSRTPAAVKHWLGFFYLYYVVNTQLFLLFPTSDPNVEAHITACLADISE